MNYDFDDTTDITNKFDRLQRNVSDAEDCLRQTERERDDFICPVIKAIFNFNPSIDRVYDYAGEVTVDYSGSTRGCEWRESVKFPRYILDSTDPLVVAQQYKELLANREKEQKLAEKRAELARLQKELGE